MDYTIKMSNSEVTLPDINETLDVHCIYCGELMEPAVETIDVDYKGHTTKVHNCRLYRCKCCSESECYSSRTVGMIENAVWNLWED